METKKKEKIPERYGREEKFFYKVAGWAISFCVSFLSVSCWVLDGSFFPGSVFCIWNGTIFLARPVS